MGYTRDELSLPRDEQEIIDARTSLMDVEKTPSMGWMFVPLVDTGAAAATIER